MAGGRTLRNAFARTKEMMMEYAYLITLGAIVAVVAASAMYTSRVQQRNAAQVQAAAGAPEIEESSEPAPTQTPRSTPLPTIAPLTVRPVTLTLGGGRVWPVSGEAIRGYSADEAVLWKALGCYQVHVGMDIAAQTGEDVLCIMDGVVDAVSRDELWGWRISVAQTDGSIARYAGLDACALSIGQSVTRGQRLGALGEIPCEAELGAHLHLEYTLEGKAENPAMLLQNAKKP